MIICNNNHNCKAKCGHKEYHKFYDEICDSPCIVHKGKGLIVCIPKLEYEMRRIIEKEGKDHAKN